MGIAILLIIITIAIVAYNFHKINKDKTSTYALTAKIITLYYLAVKEHPQSQKMSLEELLGTVCILDTALYINTGKITIFDISTVIDQAMAYSNNTHDMLTNLIGGMEILIFSADTDFSLNAIADAVTSKKSLISIVVTETMTMGKEYPLYPSIKQAVNKYFQNYEDDSDNQNEPPTLDDMVRYSL